MKIAFIDNMNNAFFSLAKYLSAEGVDCHVYTLPIEQHAAMSDTSDSPAHQFLLKKFPFQPNLATWVSYRTDEFQNVLRFLNEYDCIVACGWSIAFLARAEIKVDIVIAYGDDIDGIFLGQRLYPKFPIEAIDSFIADQVKGLRSASCVIYHSASDGLRELSIPFVSMTIPRIFYSPESNEISFRENHRLEVLSPTRHLWSSNTHVSDAYFSAFGGFKRNDLIISAFARLLKDHSRRDLVLTLSSSGPSVKDSIQMIKGLGLENHVQFIAYMSRSELWRRLSMADICIDAPQLGGDHSNSWLSDISEGALFAGTPLIARMSNVNLVKLYIPMLGAVTEDEIYAALKVLVENPGMRRLLGEASRGWQIKNTVRPIVKAFVNLFGNYKSGLGFDGISEFLLTVPAAKVVRPEDFH
jgi:glycosyltransferase involved in cell wall biosynthesis